ncbi:MAG TPA: ribosome silencing factor [Vulgatibacter sp.]|nr:ribosome silencing factor [Vulgatibacter sp.]
MASRKTTSPKKSTVTPKAAAPRKAASATRSARSATAARPTKAAKATRSAKAPAGTKAPARKAASGAKAKTSGKSPARAKNGVEVTEVAEQALEAPAAALAAARVAAEAALDKKAEDVVILDVAGLTSYADCFVIATGTSDRQVGAIADSIEDKMKKAGHRPIGVEGHGLGHWVLLDFGDVVAHVFYEEARALYDVEGLWADARRVPVG